jgi:hypothetical protein
MKIKEPLPSIHEKNNEVLVSFNILGCNAGGLEYIARNKIYFIFLIFSEGLFL